jgi:ABC-type transport system substrate-binding protein
MRQTVGARAPRRRTITRALTAVAAAALLTTACGSTTATGPADGSPGTVSHADKGVVESNGPAHPGGRIVYGLIAETNGWNPTTNQFAASGLEVARTFFDTLSAFDDQGQIHPFLAERFEHDGSFRRWTIHLRHGVTFSNGKPLDAKAVARVQNFFKSSPVTGGVYNKITSVTADGDDKVVFELAQAFVEFPMVLSSQIGVVPDPDWLQSNDSLHPVGSGPFVLDSWEIGNKLTVKRNPGYWRKDDAGLALPYLDEVEFRVITDANSRGKALQAGDVDIIQTLNGTQIQEFQQLDAFQVLSDPKGETRERFVQLNTMVAPFDDPDARRALAYATDKGSIVDAVTGNFDDPANGPFAPSSRWYADSGYPQFDQAKARELVDKVKASHGGAFSFVLTGVAETQTQQQTQILQEQWRAVGIDVTIDLQEQAKLIIGVVTGGFQAVSWGQFDAPSPLLDGVWWDPSLAVPPPAFSLNFARNKDDAIGVALEKARGSEDPAEVKAAIATVQQRLSVDLPYIWLYHEKTAIIASKRLVNLTHHELPDGATGLALQQGAHPLAQVWLAR